MSLRAPNLPIPGDPVVARGFAAISGSLRALCAPQLLDGLLLTSVVLTTSAVEVAHQLGRQPMGYVVVRRRAQAIVWDEQDSNPHPELTLRLKASAGVTVDLWVF